MFLFSDDINQSLNVGIISNLRHTLLRTLPSLAPYELQRTYQGPCQDSPAPSSPCIVPRRQKGFACWLGFWSRSRESKSNSGVFLKLLAFANFAFFAAPSLLHSFSPCPKSKSNSGMDLVLFSRSLESKSNSGFLPLLCSTSTRNFDSPTLQAFGGLVASQTRR